MPPNRLRVNAYYFAVCTFAFSCLLGCGTTHTSDEAANINVDLVLEPSPPQVGTATVTLELSDLNGQPISGGKIELEGNMNHAGMKPVFSQLEERKPGTYAGELEFTMGGDWFVLVTGELPDNVQINEKVEVPGVTSPR